MQKKTNRVFGKALQPEEIQDAEEDIICKVQLEVFSEEYQALKSNKTISPKSLLIKLSPRIDENGIIRMDGRLTYADYLPYDVKHPIILPRGHHVTKLIVKHYHERANHTGGVNFILAQLSQRFWIIAAQEEIRSWENECNECKKRKTKLATQIMAPLPKWLHFHFTIRPERCGLRRTFYHGARPGETASKAMFIHVSCDKSYPFVNGVGTGHGEFSKCFHSIH
jgi:hypothetical protein